MRGLVRGPVWQLGPIKVARSKVVAEVERTLAGVTLSQETEVSRGEALRDGLVQLVLRGLRLKGHAVYAWDVLAQPSVSG